MLPVATAAMNTPEKTTLPLFFSVSSLFIVHGCSLATPGHEFGTSYGLLREIGVFRRCRKCYDSLAFYFVFKNPEVTVNLPSISCHAGAPRRESTPWTGPFRSGTASGTRRSEPETLIRPLPPQILIRLGTQRMQWNRRCMFLARRHQKAAALH